MTRNGKTFAGHSRLEQLELPSASEMHVLMLENVRNYLANSSDTHDHPCVQYQCETLEARGFGLTGKQSNNELTEYVLDNSAKLS